MAAPPQRCIFYAFFSDAGEQHANLMFFLRCGTKHLLSTDIHVIVTGGPAQVDPATFDVALPDTVSLTVSFEGSDCATDATAWSRAVLAKLSRDCMKCATYVFINSTCRGPFLPTYASAGGASWLDRIEACLRSGPDVRLVGPMIQVASDTDTPFVHTYMFAVDAAGLDILTRAGLWRDYGKLEAVHVFERGVTSQILDAGHNVMSLLLAYSGVDWRDRSLWDHKLWMGGWSERPAVTCHEVPGNYFGIDAHPLEVMFIKNVRRVSCVRGPSMAGFACDGPLQRYTDWLSCGPREWLSCGRPGGGQAASGCGGG
jgi:hypothetical protein